jgi:putative heme d1 biosynthesis radical SAM protein NirJ2
MIISWNTTYECNLKCKHCYRDAGEKRENELSKEEGFSLLEELAHAGFKIVILSGGEPLLRKDIYELIAQAKSLGLKPVLGTNGTLITEKVAERLKEAGAERIGISLDSPDSSCHDEFRQRKGAYQSTLAGIDNCKNAGLEFQIHTTLMDFNKGDLERITDLAVKVGARAHHIFFVVSVGRAEQNVKCKMQNEKLYYEDILQRILAKQREVEIELKPVCAPQFVRIAKEMGLETRFQRGCLAGISYCCVLPEGDLHPCPYLPISCGNIREKGFFEIWKTSEVFKRLREQDYSGKCGVCGYKKVCGGCRASSLQYSGDYLASDPWCSYQ